MTTPPQPPDLFREPERIASTRRSLEIRRLAAYYDGTQYDGRPEWFSGLDRNGKVVPLRERKPCVIYPLPRAACNQATRFTFGEGRYPAVAVAHTEDDAIDGSRALSEDDAETLTAFIAAVTESCGLKSAMRTMLRHGLSQRTAVACLGVRRGSFVIDMPRAQDCVAEFEDGDPSAPVVRMTWCYVYQREVVVNDVLTTEPYLFRRDFTATEVVFYHDAPQPPVGKPVEWTVDKAVAHGFGFCPVVWVRNLPAQHCQEIDGVSLYDGLEDEFDALNFALSQRHRGIVYFGTPQAWETGVDDGEQPGETARVARPARASTDPSQSPAGPQSKSTDPLPRDGYTKGGAQARKTAPDQIWSYKSETAKVGVMETTGKAFEVASAHVLDIRARILEAIDVILLDPTTVAGKGDMSAKALALMYAPLLALVDELRDCWWSNGLAPLIGMVLRINAALGGRGILIPNAATVAALCRRFTVEVEGGGKVWAPPRMVPSWGPYFSPSNEEIAALVTATAAAKDAGFIRAETAIRNVAPPFGETEVEELAEEAEQREEEARQMMLQGGAGGQPGDADDAEGGKPGPAKAPSGGKPKPGPRKTKPAANAVGG